MTNTRDLAGLAPWLRGMAQWGNEFATSQEICAWTDAVEAIINAPDRTDRIYLHWIDVSNYWGLEENDNAVSIISGGVYAGVSFPRPSDAQPAETVAAPPAVVVPHPTNDEIIDAIGKSARTTFLQLFAVAIAKANAALAAAGHAVRLEAKP